MSGAESGQSWELEIPEGDLRVSASDLAAHGLRPGTHVRLVPQPIASPSRSRGSLSHKLSRVPSWEDFESAHREVIVEVNPDR